MSGEARWAAVVVNYNAGDHLVACVRSLHADASAGPVEIVVVDNDSDDGSPETLAAAVPGVRIVPSGANVGLARAANLGIAATRAPVVAVLNPDTELRPGTAGHLVARLAAERDLGALGPRVESPDGTLYPSARIEPRPFDAAGHALLGAWRPANRFTRRYRQLDADWTVPRAVDWLSGAAIWFRRDALDAAGGWDERFFMFMEDVDLCRRLREAGWRVEYDPRGCVMHVEGVSRAAHPYRMIVAHHRSAWRYAVARWRGARRLLLPLAALGLSVRALAAIAARRLGGRRSRPAARG